MGLRQHIEAGAQLTRITNTTATDPVGSGSIALGSATALLRIQSSTTCRVRLYDNESSLLNAGEIARQYGNLNISSSVALIGDFTMSANQVNFIDPVLYSIPEDGTVYYRVEPPASTNLNITYYLMDDPNVTPQVGTAYSVDNRRTITIEESLPSDDTPVPGLWDAGSVPKTYLLVSASLSDPDHAVRLRLYRVSSSVQLPDEQVRPFSTEPSASAQLIVDVLLSGSNPLYFVPKIIGANLDNMGTDLNIIKGNRTAFEGKAELYYILQNLTTTSDDVDVGLHLFALED